jgi:hypothetical protein
MKKGMGVGHSLFLVEEQIQHPAATYMRSRTAAMVQDVRIVAAGVFQGMRSVIEDTA